MKKVNEYKSLSSDDEVSSIIYAILCSVDKLEHKCDNFMYFHPLVFIVNSLYDEDFPILRYSSFITRDGGARYVMNDVSSYRKAKGFDVSQVAHLRDLFSRYGCLNNIDIINFIYSIYTIRDSDELLCDEAIQKALMAYRVYYKNNISLSYLPDFKRVFTDYTFVLNNDREDISFSSSSSNFNGFSNGNKAVSFNHLKYPEVKMLIVADGSGDILDENVSYTFCDMMNEWFWQCEPYSSNFADKMELAIKDIDGKICSDNPNLLTASVSVFICTKDTFYVSSIGTSRVYLMKGNHLEKIDRIETLYDDLQSKGSVLSFDIFMKDIPADLIGYSSFDPSKGNVHVDSIPSHDFDGALLLTKSVYDNISLDDLEEIVFGTYSSSILDQISENLSMKGSSSLAIYQTREKGKKRLFSRKKSSK